jgi:hypothetical protein
MYKVHKTNGSQIFRSLGLDQQTYTRNKLSTIHICRKPRAMYQNLLNNLLKRSTIVFTRLPLKRAA